METKQRLELTWVGKGEEIAVEPRILLHDAENDYGDPTASNMLIHGDNLLALKALEQEYAGKVKCIYIDPPYNTGAAFEHYDDNLEHSTWLSLMRVRLIHLRNLLREDGFIFVQIDNCEMAYLKVLMDEVFGRNNFVNDIVWKRKGGSVNPRNKLNNNTDYILLYQKSEFSTINLIYSLDDEDTQKYIKERFTSVDENGRRYQASPLISPSYSPTLIYNYKGYQSPPNGWSLSREKMEQFDREGRLYFPPDKSKRIRRKQFLDEYKGQPIGNLWTDIFVINSMSNERTDFKGGQKPEMLIERIISMATAPGDLVLDSFLGSGTTAAVAHKMGRRWIGIELGEHCYTHCKPRLDKVIDGEQGGISKAVNWKGGGGYKFYELAPTLIVQDKHGNPIFSEQYSPEMLVQAVAKVCGYHYAPDAKNAWKQAYCQDNSFLFVTTRYFTAAVLDEIAQELGEFEHLLVCAPAFDVGLNQRYENISVRKIPQAVLDKCKYGVDNYNLNIIDPPQIDEEEWDDAE